PGFSVRKGPLSVFGCPLPGWTTPYMGPVVGPGTQTRELYEAIFQTLRREGFRHAEVRPHTVDVDAVRPIGCLYAPTGTYVATIAVDSEGILASFSKSTRKVIRRGLKGEIEATFATDSSFVDRYYDQLLEVFEKSGRVPSYTRNRVRALWNHLMPTGRLLATQVMLGDACIATRIDICGNGWLHSFGSASYRQWLRHHPNELARYHAMCEAARRRLTQYDLMGRGDYKAKFNARLVENPGFIQSSRLLMTARSAAKKAARLKQWAKRAFRRNP
ncbi:MAG: GNAT family N-acetyltransferase, partial [Planctomycetota bacterium]|nr:GNAT family N-acetyltransferase [Planctomycetota bacterium]